jgi:hypothetical protein
MSDDLTTEDVAAALATLDAFLAALITRDDAMAERLYYGPSARLIGAPQGGFLAVFRSAWAVVDDELAHLRPTGTARIIESPGDPDRLVAFGLVTLTDQERIHPFGSVLDGPRQAHVLALIATADGWRVWGTPPVDQFASARLLTLPPPPVGPIV